jgi:hypothetical protein
MINEECDKYRFLDGVHYCFLNGYHLPTVLANTAIGACRWCNYKLLKKEMEMLNVQKSVCALRPMRKLRAT